MLWTLVFRVGNGGRHQPSRADEEMKIVGVTQLPKPLASLMTFFNEVLYSHWLNLLSNNDHWNTEIVSMMLKSELQSQFLASCWPLKKLQNITSTGADSMQAFQSSMPGPWPHFAGIGSHQDCPRGGSQQRSLWYWVNTTGVLSDEWH